MLTGRLSNLLVVFNSVTLVLSWGNIFHQLLALLFCVVTVTSVPTDNIPFTLPFVLVLLPYRRCFAAFIHFWCTFHPDMLVQCDFSAVQMILDVSTVQVPLYKLLINQWINSIAQGL